MFDRILLPVDLTGKNESALTSARELLGESGSLILLHVIETIADAPFEDMQDFYQRLEEKGVVQVPALKICRGASHHCGSPKGCGITARRCSSPCGDAASKARVPSARR